MKKYIILLFTLLITSFIFEGCLSSSDKSGGGFNQSGSTVISYTPNTTISGYLYDDALSSPILYAGVVSSRMITVVVDKKQYSVRTDIGGFFKTDIELLNNNSPVIIKFQKKDGTYLSGEYNIEKGKVYFFNAFIEGSAKVKLLGEFLKSYSKVEEPDSLKIELKKLLDEKRKNVVNVSKIIGRVVTSASHVLASDAVSGVIITNETFASGLSGVSVKCSNSLSAVTDQNGYFSISGDFKEGIYSLSFKKTGFPDKTLSIAITSSDYGVGNINCFVEMDSGLKSISLSKSSDISGENQNYDLSVIKGIALYLDNRTAEVMLSWSAETGSIANNIYTPPQSKKGIVLFTAKYAEGSNVKTAIFTLTINALLSSITLSKYNETIETGVPYDIRSIKTTVVYSDNSTREVLASWAADRGTITGYSYIPPAGYTGNVNFTITYTEAQITKTVTLKVTVSQIIKTLTLSKGSDEVLVGSSYNLAMNTASILYSDKTSKVIMPVWSLNGIILEDQRGIVVPMIPQILTLTASYSENGLTRSAYLNIKVKPSITSLSSYSGVAGDVIKITGAGFKSARGESRVRFNQKYAYDYRSWSDSEITLSVPQGCMPGNVFVIINDIESDGVSFDASYVASISPSSGTAGTIVSLTGSGFGDSKGQNRLMFDDIEAQDIISWSNAKIVARVPVNAHNGDVYVEMNGLKTNSVIFGLTTIISISPAIVKPGDRITIIGNGFGVTQESSKVKFNDIIGTEIIRWSDELIETIVPLSAKTGYLTVIVGNVASNLQKFDITSVSSLSPSYGPVGSAVEIIGAGFNDYQQTASVAFSGIPVGNVILWSNNKIIVNVPNGAVTGKVSVKINNVDFMSPSNFELTGISSITPSVAAVGSIVNIYGSGFGPSTGSSTVSFGSVQASEISYWSNSKITVKVPSGAVTAPVKLTISGVDSNSVNFSVTNVNGITPSRGYIGSVVTINGSNFGSVSGSVKFNDLPATDIVSWTASKIVVKVPAGAVSGSVIVTAGGVDNIGFSFEVFNISSVAPSVGTAGNLVTINGSGFGPTQGGSIVKFGSVQAAEVMSWSDSQVIVKVPANSSSSNVTVTVSSTPSNGFYFKVIAITSLSQNYGPSGMSFTINGAGFGGSPSAGNKVVFNGADVSEANIQSWSDSKIIMKVPAGSSSGNVMVSVDNITSVPVYFDVTKINSVNPLQGTSGDQIVIYGAGFGATRGSNTVKFNSVVATNIISWSGEKIIAAIPPQSPNGSAVEVVISGVSSNSVPLSVISVNALSCSKGATGSQITISGTGFGNSKGSNLVKINNVEMPVVSGLWTDSEIRVSVPANASSGYVKANINGRETNGIYFKVAKFDSDAPFVPAYGPAGTSVILKGFEFGDVKGNVYFNGVNAPLISEWRNERIVVTAPAGALSGSVSIKSGTLEVSSGASNFKFTKILSLTPSYGPAGSSVTISGEGFGSNQAEVKYNSASVNSADVSSWSDSSIVFKVPANSSGGGVKVCVWNIDSNSLNFDVTKINSLDKSKAKAGDSLTITGTGFGNSQSSSKLLFTASGSSFVEAAVNINDWSMNTIKTTVPASAISGNIVIESGGLQLAAYPFKVLSISSLSPVSGYDGLNVTINGAGFGEKGAADYVKFNSTFAQSSDYISWSDNRIVVKVPVGASSGDVVVFSAGSFSNAVSFKVINITSISPSTISPGLNLTINGTGFGVDPSAIKVYFKDILSTNVSGVGNSSFKVKVPDNVTADNIRVEVSGVSSNSVAYKVIRISSIEPASANSGDTLTINGEGFGSARGVNDKVMIGAVALDVADGNWSDVKIVATVVNTAVSGNLYIISSGAESDKRWIEVNVNYAYKAKFGSMGNGDGAFNFPGDVALDSAGNFYVADTYNHRIQIFNGSGTFVSKFGTGGDGNGQFINVSSVALDSSNNIYAVDSGNNRVQKFTSAGAFVKAWGSYGTGGTQFNNPTKIFIDSNSKIYVVDSGNNAIKRFNLNGDFEFAVGSYGTGDGQFNNVSGVAVSSDGKIYAADKNNNRIQVFDSNGQFIQKWGASGTEDSKFNLPSDIAIDQGSNVYVADRGNDRIQKFNSKGGLLNVFGTSGNGNAEFNKPSGLFVDSSGNVIIADTNNNRIEVFERN